MTRLALCLLGAAFVAGILLPSAASAHAPLFVEPGVLILEPGETSVVSLRLVNISLPNEVSQAARLVSAREPAGVRVVVDDALIAPEEEGTLPAVVSVAAGTPPGGHRLQFNAIGEVNQVALTSGFLLLVVPPPPDWQGEVNEFGEVAVIWPFPQILLLEPGGSGSAEIIVVNGSGRALRLEAEPFFENVAAEFTDGNEVGSFGRLALRVDLPDEELSGAFSITLRSRGGDGAVVASGQLFVALEVRDAEPSPAAGESSDPGATNRIPKRPPNKTPTPPRAPLRKRATKMPRVRPSRPATSAPTLPRTARRGARSSRVLPKPKTPRGRQRPQATPAANGAMGVP